MGKITEYSEYKRECPNPYSSEKCRRIIYYASVYTYKTAINNKSVCTSCSRMKIWRGNRRDDLLKHAIKVPLYIPLFQDACPFLNPIPYLLCISLACFKRSSLLFPRHIFMREQEVHTDLLFIAVLYV